MFNSQDFTPYELTTLRRAARILERKLSRVDVLTDSLTTRMYVSTKLRHEQREVFMGIFLDNRHRVIASEILFVGTIDGCAVHPREVAKAALNYNAAAMIFAHNHPSGVTEPSQADISITHRLKRLLEELDIRTLDHLIVGEGAAFSMAEKGLL